MTQTIDMPDLEAEYVASLDATSDHWWWEQRDELRGIRDYATAKGANPSAALVATIMRVLAQTPSSVHLPGIIGGGKGSLNLFAALVGMPGGGKGAATSASQYGALFPQGDLFDRIPPGSAEGLITSYATKVKDKETGEATISRERDSILFDVAEITDLGGQVGRSGSVLTGQLLRAFSGESLGFAYVSDSGVTIPAHEYRFTMVAGVQPRNSGVLLGDGTVSAGLPHRFVWALADNPNAPDFSLDQLRAQPITLHLPDWSGGQRMVEVEESIIMEIGQQHVLRLRGSGEALNGHRMYAQLKVAAAFAFMRGSKRVEHGDWGLAADVMTHSDRARESCLDALEQHRIEQAAARGRDQGVARVAASDAEAEARAKKITSVRAAVIRQWEKQGKPSTWPPIRRELRSNQREIADQIAMDLAREIPGFPASDLFAA